LNLGDFHASLLRKDNPGKLTQTAYGVKCACGGA
jgi:hypothetical protein